MQPAFARVAIIDFRLGNMFSVANACRAVALDSLITSDPGALLESDAAILPGVGAFADAMENLRNLKLISAIEKFIESGRPFMGVCLGLQLLFRESDEFGATAGLGFIQGKVKRFPSHTSSGRKIKVPQMGWNMIHRPPGATPDRWKGTPLSHLPEGACMYFVHSFFVEPVDPRVVLTTTRYGDLEYCSAITSGNIYASQFHPEKSAHDGISIYRAWSHKILEHSRK